ncbi:MAG: hypothetical protein H0V44_10945 [Planctomycetes bacterium]|nr:hypothetical protein [Planctomycetota bacterium]
MTQPGSGRFAPSTTGPAHPGTLLAALLCWLDARSCGARVVVRLEDLDPDRCTPAHACALVADLAWLGLEWDAVSHQSAQTARHHAALDRLAAAGRLYPSTLSRAQLQAIGHRAPDGGWAYDNRERDVPLPQGGWRTCDQALRARLDDGVLCVRDESGLDLSQDPAAQMGDPVVRRRDGAVAYQLAVVVDDAADGITRVVRGRDISTSTATQRALQDLLGVSAPVYRHHLLLLEPRGGKLAKLHGSVGADQLRRHYQAPRLCAFLARCAGLIDDSVDGCAPADLLPGFAWSRVRAEDVVVQWTGERLIAQEPR